MTQEEKDALELEARERKEALERLIQLAKGDTGGGRRCADFLLAWWNSAECGGFDMTDLWGVDPDVAKDMVTVFSLIAGVHKYPNDLGYARDFQQIIASWRPELVTK